MKNKFILPLVILFSAFTILTVSTPVAAIEFLYVNQDVVHVFEKADRSSAVLDEIYGGQRVAVDHYNVNNSNWVYIWDPNYRGDGQQYGWVHMTGMSYTMPPRYCDHEWSSWETIRSASCTQDGYRERHCSVCGTTQHEDIPALGHDWSDWQVTRRATCTSEGERWRECWRCGREETQTLERLPHTWSDWRTTKQATCTSEGERIRTCEVCGREDVQITEKLPHTYGPWKVIKEPTCTSEGERVHTCEVCGYESFEMLDKLPHEFEWKIIEEATDHSSGIRSAVCKVCGYTEESVSYDPDGTLRRGDRGENVREMQQLLADQNYLNADGADGIFGGGTEKAVMNFQTAQGFTADGVCWPQTLQKLRHEFGPWETISHLTRTTAGERKRVCIDCGFEQHETLTPRPHLNRGDRGEGVRAVQQMITSIGFDAGAYDGIYGQKLDNAYSGFAAQHGIEYQPGQINAAQLDVLVSAWTASVPAEEWMGEGSPDTPVDLALTVTPVDEESDDDVKTYTWSVTNMGSSPCLFAALLLSFGDQPDFKADTITLAIDGAPLGAACDGSASGTFEVSREMGEGTPHFCALAVSEETGAKWLSNIA